jgi:hypothetical protein
MTSPPVSQPHAETADAPLPPFPVRTGTPDERRSIELLQRWAGEGARVEGCVGDARVGQEDVAHAALGALAALVVLLPPVHVYGQVAMAVVTLSGVARVGGRDVLGGLVSRRPSWNLRLGRPSPTTRYIVAAAADRAPPERWLREGIAAALVVALLTAVVGAPGILLPVVPAGILVGAAVYAALVAREPHVRADLPEAHAVAAALQSLARARALARGDVAGVVAGCAADRATGVLGFLDWWAVDAQRAVVIWVEAEADAERRPVERLRRAGWRVVVVRVPPGDRDGMGVDREWLVG